MIKIAPSILAADFSALKQQVELVEKAGADYLHIDIMDGHFVPNITIGQVVVESIRPYSNLIFDVHLMIENCENYIKSFANAGADIITIHAEATNDILKCIDMIKACGVKPCVAINPDTPLDAINDYMDKVEMILIMSVFPGYGGQSFMPKVLDKVRQLRTLKGDNFDIEIDGGITPSNIKEVLNAGANVIVSGSAIYNAKDPCEVINLFKNAYEEMK